ncbi:hypothetical protein [Novosphingobium sp. 9]|uniref:hypothetical protein n=1 Tax=Novosphingobium sp. 9 TaxID=2025349 RepID=UPI0021B55ED3|nr:hypothetical protein [Novosphingobium sp. 9]
MSREIFFRFVVLGVLAASLMASPAQAYVGPGSGLGAIGVVFGVIGTVFLSLVSLVWYPLKRGYRRVRGALSRIRGAAE